MMSYLKECHGKWLYVPFISEDRKKLNEKYSVNGIPTLVIIKPDGSVAENDVAEEVFDNKNTEELIKKWKSKM
ncbi:unnamed protein product [Bursaphelenchus okinawaensis]|uniref:Thioredoxin-like fold domain-containing protein n=1 Tax=Bursaphelenchus okinawaensis TaxID=465554 RepID=A0A811KXH2_9BILA|nr:unnamed protein product [Bursaphelenchus okinawaensis]CAG9113419.1 unnamed protein product [Bursaphelenchus okinawaensis]